MVEKTFIFKYDPTGSLNKMFANMEQAIKTGKPNIQPKNVIRSNSLEAIYRSITLSRWEIFTCLVEKKPANLTSLARLLNKDYSNVWKDIQALEGLKIIKLKEEGKETRPIALYDRIVFDLPVKESSLSKPTSRISLSAK